MPVFFMPVTWKTWGDAQLRSELPGGRLIRENMCFSQIVSFRWDLLKRGIGKRAMKLTSTTGLSDGPLKAGDILVSVRGSDSKPFGLDQIFKTEGEERNVAVTGLIEGDTEKENLSRVTIEVERVSLRSELHLH